MAGMGWVFAALIVVVIGFVLLASVGKLGQMAPQIDDRRVPALPADRPITADDLGRIRFAVVARGYSMEQVDAVLDLLATQISTATGPVEEPSPSTGNGWPSVV